MMIKTQKNTAAAGFLTCNCGVFCEWKLLI